MRHPEDPEVAPDSKAAAALCLAVLGAVTGLAIGGAVPATIALILAGQAGADLRTGQGWLTGSGQVRWARRLAWTGLALAAGSLILIVVLRLLQDGGWGERDFPATVD
jgi:hydroxylaminobenzene mutase